VLQVRGVPICAESTPRLGRALIVSPPVFLWLAMGVLLLTVGLGSLGTVVWLYRSDRRATTSDSAPRPEHTASALVDAPSTGLVEDEGGSTLGDVVRPLEGHAIAAGAEPSTGLDIDISEAISVAEEEDDPTGPVARILVTAAGSSDAGRRRAHNEDAFLVLGRHGLFAIADGMGGYAAGEVASQLALDTMRAAFEGGDLEGTRMPAVPRRGAELIRSIQLANTAILEQARSNEAQQGMGTTLVAARFSPNRQRVYIAHVGDSRLYRLRGHDLTLLTADHTLAALGVQGPGSNKLSRAVGVFDDVEVDLSIDEPLVGDYYVLCSDGLSKMVPEGRIAELVRARAGLDPTVQALITEANARGGKDNVTVILVRVDSPPPL